MVFTDVWGFDEDAVKALKKMELKLEATKKNLRADKQFQILLSSSANFLSENHRAVRFRCSLS